MFDGWGILTTLGAALVGGVGTYIVTRLLDRGRRRNEARDISQSLYCEIADRVARSLNDYLYPWRGHSGGFDIARIGKFRPVSAVVYPGVAGKLGLLPPHILVSVIQFYFRLDAIRREIDDLIRDYEVRLGLVTLRFQENVAAGLKALEAFSVNGASDVDRAAADSYPHVSKEDAALRDLLRKHQPARRART